MADQRDRRRRQAERDRARLAAENRAAKARRQRRIMAGAVALIVIVGTLGAFIGSRKQSSSPSTTTTSTSSTLPAKGTTPTPAAPGATLTTAPPCPAFDGSAPRTTTFGGPPPMCIDTGSFYRATITTSVGTIVEQLNPSVAPQTVNAFVVLALYHYYDGQPVTNITDRQSFSAGMLFSGGSGQPGFTIASEAPAKGSIPTPGAIFMAPATASGGVGGQFVIATRDLAANLSTQLTGFGIMLDGESTLATINDLASSSGSPVRPITITGIAIERTSPIAR